MLNWWLERALLRLEQRVRQLLVADEAAPATLRRLLQQERWVAAHGHVLRHLPPEGARLTELARACRMSKQAAQATVEVALRWELVQRQPDARDGRAIRLVWTPEGHGWRNAYWRAMQQAEVEFAQAVGAEVATVAQLALEAYGAEPDLEPA